MENVELNLKQTAQIRRKNNETRTTKGGGKNQFERGQKIKLKTENVRNNFSNNSNLVQMITLASNFNLRN